MGSDPGLEMAYGNGSSNSESMSMEVCSISAISETTERTLYAVLCLCASWCLDLGRSKTFSSKAGTVRYMQLGAPGTGSRVCPEPPLVRKQTISAVRRSLQRYGPDRTACR